MVESEARINPQRLSEDRLAQADLDAFLTMLKAATEVTSDTDDLLRQSGAGISARDWDVLALIQAMGPSRPSQVLRRVALTNRPQTLSSIIGRLERLGLVVRRPHPEDSRGVLVEATPEGAALVDRAFPLIDRRVIRQFAAHYTDAEITTLATLLSRISDKGNLGG